MEPLRNFFETLAESWDEQQPLDRDDVLNRLLLPFASQLEHARSILEVGTGTGALIPHLTQRAPQARLVSIDLASEMLRRARHRFPQTLLVQSDVHHLPFSPSRFDLAVCHNSFPHFADKPRALHNLESCLQAGGLLLILHDLSRTRVNEVHQRAEDSVIHQDLIPTEDETKLLLKNAGFIDITVWDAEDRFVAIGTRPLQESIQRTHGAKTTRCERCGAEIPEEEAMEPYGQTLCELCAMQALSPSQACDPWAVRSAQVLAETDPASVSVTSTQAQILQVLEETGGTTLEDLAQQLQMDPPALQRELATLRHMEKVRGEMRESGKVICLW